MAPLGETPSNNLWVGNLAPDVTDVDLMTLFQKYGQIDSITVYSSSGFGFIYFRNINDSKKAKDALQGSFVHGIPLRIKFAKPEQGPESREIRDGQYHNKSIGHPDPQHRPQDFVRIHSDPIYDAGFTRQHPFQLHVGQRGDRPFQRAQMGMFGHNRPMLASSNVLGRFPPYGIHGPDIPARPLGMQGRFDPVISDYSQLQRETKRSRIDGAYDSSYPHNRTSDRGPVLNERYDLGPFGSNVSSGPVIVSQANNSVIPADARISPGCIWRGVIAKGGIHVCYARCFLIGECVECKIPYVVNYSSKTGFDMLTQCYAVAVGFNVVYFFPDTEKDFASYTKFLRYLSSKDRVGVSEFCDGTTLFLVPPSDFLEKVLKVDGPTRIYGVVLKYAPHTLCGTSLPPESNQPQNIDAPQITSSQAAYDAMPSVERVSEINDNQITQARALLTPELVATLTNMLPSSSVEGTVGASAGMSASDVAVAPQYWRYVDPQLQLGRHHDAAIAHGTVVLGHYGTSSAPMYPASLSNQTHVSQSQDSQG